MYDYPERISISPVHRQKRDDDFYLVDRKAFPGKGVEYVRADMVTDFETHPVGTGKRIEELEAKLAKAVEAERERCAKVAESVALPMDGRNAKAQADYMSKVIASAIRAELKGQDDE